MKDSSSRKMSATPSELFHRHRARFLANQVRYIFDFDGTLADFHEDPRAVTLSEETLGDLRRLSPTPRENILILSGRDLGFLKGIFKDNVHLVGEHGMMGDSSLPLKVPEKAFAFFNELTQTHPGSFIEKKESSVSWHYRQAQGTLNDREVSAYKARLEAALKPEGFRCLHFRFILEVVSELSGKKLFLERFLKDRSPQELLLCFGDDVSEEEFFPLVEELGGLSFAVGSRIKGGQHRFSNPQQLRDWISELSRLIHP